MITTKQLVAASLTLGFLCCSVGDAWATHFRGAHFSWERISGNTVRFTSTQEWDASDVDTMPINPGDGDPTIIGSVVTLFTGVDTAGESYRIVRYTVDHTYAGEGPFTAFLGNLSSSLNCCRLNSLINAGGDDYRIETVVDLRNGNLGSPASTIPPVATTPQILQMPEGTIGVTRDLGPGISDPDSTFTCAFAATGGGAGASGISANPAGLTISPACVLSWDTTATTAGEKYMVQVEILEDHSGNTAVIDLDFIIEIVAASCGDGSVNQVSEVCDGTDDSACPGECLGSCQCPVCGDNSINQPAEQCDGTAGGVLGPCPGDCRGAGATGECLCPICGDDIIDPAFGEQCDGTDDAACPGACTGSCVCGVCGDNSTNAPGEECDGIDDSACPGACRAGCVCAICGDDIVDAGAGEVCDGTDDGACPGECSGSCTCPTCGNNVAEGSETCDGLDAAACPGACRPAGDPNECMCPFCGDGSINTGAEQCDGGDDAACPGDCLAPGDPNECSCPVCGDGDVNQISEVCDGADDSACPGDCLSDCSCAICGDGVAESPVEQCDGIDDAACPGLCGAPASANACQCPTCGDDAVNGPGEECDGTDDAACPGECLGSCVCPVCGDGSVNQGSEVCDGADDSACPGLCKVDCSCTVCGDNLADAPEQCDGTDDAACPGDCLPSGDPNECSCPVCGDDDVNQVGEQCDGSDDAACPGACTGSCICAVCGDGVAEAPAETCDTGDDAACPGLCLPLGDPNQCNCPICGDGDINQVGEICDDGPANSDVVADACRTDCTLPTCGDGVTDTGEECDGAPIIEVCNNSIDDDADNAIDCDDADCQTTCIDEFGVPFAPPSVPKCTKHAHCRVLDPDSRCVGVPSCDATCNEVLACEPLGPDPSIIKLYDDRPDLLKMHMLFIPRSELFPVTEGFALLVTNASGVVYLGRLLENDLLPRDSSGKRFAFKDRTAKNGTGLRDGLYKVNVRLRTYQGDPAYSFKIRAYADLSAATVADMTTQIAIGNDTTFLPATWRQSSTGWKLRQKDLK